MGQPLLLAGGVPAIGKSYSLTKSSRRIAWRRLNEYANPSYCRVYLHRMKNIGLGFAKLRRRKQSRDESFLCVAASSPWQRGVSPRHGGDGADHAPFSYVTLTQHPKRDPLRHQHHRRGQANRRPWHCQAVEGGQADFLACVAALFGVLLVSVQIGLPWPSGSRCSRSCARETGENKRGK